MVKLHSCADHGQINYKILPMSQKTRCPYEKIAINGYFLCDKDFRGCKLTGSCGHLFECFKLYLVCFVVAKCELVYNVESINGLC